MLEYNRLQYDDEWKIDNGKDDHLYIDRNLATKEITMYIHHGYSSTSDSDVFNPTTENLCELYILIGILLDG